MPSFLRSVLSSDGVTEYAVEFIFDGPSVRVTCTCGAAQNTMLCKHRLLFLDNCEDAELLPYISASLIPIAFAEYASALNDIDRRKKDIDAEAKAIKKAFARRLAEGI